jgi:ABC-type antimicrobial peptide transport system permease subunit
VKEPPTPYLHFAALQRPFRYNYLVARTRGDAAQLLAALRRELLAMEPGLVFVNSATMTSSLESSLLPARVGALLAGGFGGLGTLLAGIGLYGVIAFSVARRTREIGVRMAVGANAGTVLSMVMRQGLTLTVIGAALGILVAALAARAMSGALYGIGPFDPVAWLVALTVLVIAAALANFIPARRAMQINPVTALRTE